MPAESEHRVVIVGGGFAGLQVALGLKRAAVRVTLVDRRNFHLFQPLLYQVATGGLSPANIAAPLRSVLAHQRNAEVLLAEVEGFDPPGRRLLLADGTLPYDTLVVAAGVRGFYFGHDEWEPLAPGLKTVEDATAMRARILSAFEAAERQTDPEEIARAMTFVVVGAGPTGVELAGAIGELARHTLKRDFRHIDSARARVILIEGLDRVLPRYPEDLSARAALSLQRLGVEVRTSTRVTQMREGAITVQAEDGREEEIRCRTVHWAAGVQASPLGKALAEACGAETDRLGRVVVEPDCSAPGHAEIFVIGDLAHFAHGSSEPLGGVAPVAIQQGRYVADVIRRRLAGRGSPPFRYQDHGSMATIGRAAAVAHMGRLRLGGFVAWLAWLVVHLMQLVGFQNRLLVFTQWAWNYFTRNRSARLITEVHAERESNRRKGNHGDTEARKSTPGDEEKG